MGKEAPPVGIDLGTTYRYVADAPARNPSRFPSASMGAYILEAHISVEVNNSNTCWC